MLGISTRSMGITTAGIRETLGTEDMAGMGGMVEETEAMVAIESQVGSRGSENVVRSVRRAALGDEPILRELRLQALSEAPDAFGSTYEREVARTTSDWQRWMSPGATFILDGPAGARGIVAGLRDETDSAVVHLMAMWVHPTIRGSGAADELVAAVLAWGASEGAQLVRLNVIQGNDRARRFYERMGFCPTGHREVRERDGVIEMQMERRLGP
jgi:ribosomal protein S18 acetylase RimI-like enzyme